MLDLALQLATAALTPCVWQPTKNAALGWWRVSCTMDALPCWRPLASCWWSSLAEARGGLRRARFVFSSLWNCGWVRASSLLLVMALDDTALLNGQDLATHLYWFPLTKLPNVCFPAKRAQCSGPGAVT